jgi:phosphoenolpyruvate synthase/pyruvate phosphate dikinase
MVSPLHELRRGDAPVFGGKSASLGELLAAGIDVPPGFALSAAAYEAFVADPPVLPAELDTEDVGALNAASATIREALRAAPIPEDVREEVVRGYGALGADDPPVAVRSSALDEDGAEASFAGQQDTFLWVRGADAVVDAVRGCWTSLHNPEAISYRARRGGPEQPPAMGVTVQRMVDAAVSGVMFTCNPVSGDPSTVVVNASWGLGLAVVGGEVTPDEYRVSKVTREVLHRAVGDKAVEYAAGTTASEVDAGRREAECLSEERLGELVELGRRVERVFGGHQDIEWAIPRDDAGVLVLQSRPVTGRAARAEPRRRSALSLVMDTFGAKAE